MSETFSSGMINPKQTNKIIAKYCLFSHYVAPDLSVGPLNGLRIFYVVIALNNTNKYKMICQSKQNIRTKIANRVI